MPLSPGTALGVLDITGLFGRGGIGEVYRATDSKLECEVAIKVLPDGEVSRNPRDLVVVENWFEELKRLVPTDN